MNNKLIVVLCFMILLLGSVSAFNFDNKVSPNSLKTFDGKNVNGNKLLEKYNPIEIKNSFGYGKTLFEGYLSQHDDFCGNECTSTMQIKLNENGVLIEDITFETILNDGNRLEEPIKSYKIYINDKPYELGTVIKAGTYEVKLEGKKKSSKTVDWIIKTNGKWLNDWATWGNISLGDDAEVILDFPADNAIAYTFNQTFNCSANITGGDYLMNISLWTNESGDWGLRNITNLLENKREGHGIGYDGGTTATSKEGVVILIGDNNITLINVTMQSDITATKVDLTWNNATIIDTATIVGLTGTFSTPITLLANTRYRLEAHSDGGSYQHRYKIISSSPIVETDFEWATGSVAGSDYGYWMNIYYIGFNVTKTSSTQTWYKTINYTNLWGCKACDSDGDCGFAPSNYTLFLDTNFPQINITYPLGILDYNLEGDSINLNWTVNDTNLDTCWYNYNGTNQTVTCGDNTTTFILEEGNNNLTFYANDSVGNENSSITSWSYKIFGNSQTYNSSTYETATETFNINVTANSSLTNTQLIYDGTTYATTKSGTVYSRTLQAPEVSAITNKPFYWNFTYAGSEFHSDNYNQTVQPILLSICNSTNTIPYINLSFKDEATNNLMNATIDSSTWEYWLGDGTVTKELLFYNNTLNWNYSFCFSPGNRTLHNTRSVQFSSDGYPQRAYDASTDLTNTTLSKVLYLLSSADGIYTNIQVIDASERVISGVQVTVERQFSGIWTVVGQSNTDASGSVTFWVNPDYDHRFTYVKSGCTTRTETIKPTQTNYIQTLACTGTGEETGIYASPIEGLRYSRFPASGIIIPGITNFTFNIVSTKDNIIGVKFDIFNATDLTLLLTQNSTCTPSGCTISNTYNVPAGSSLRGRYYVNLGGGYVLIEGDAAWVTITPYSGDHGTLKDFFLNFNRMFQVSDTPSVEDRNKQEFSKFVFIFFLFAVVYSLFNKATGYDSANPGLIIYPLTALILMGSLAAGFICANHGCQGMFYYYDFAGQTITEKLGKASGFMNNYVLAIMSGFLWVGYIMSTMKRNL